MKVSVVKCLCVRTMAHKEASSSKSGASSHCDVPNGKVYSLSTLQLMSTVGEFTEVGPRVRVLKFLLFKGRVRSEGSFW